jgi:hypothetical protein
MNTEKPEVGDQHEEKIRETESVMEGGSPVSVSVPHKPEITLLQKEEDIIEKLGSLYERGKPGVGEEEDILNKYLDNAYYLYEERIYKHGYDNRTTIIHTGPLPKNVYDNILEPDVHIDNELY